MRSQQVMFSQCVHAVHSGRDNWRCVYQLTFLISRVANTPLLNSPSLSSEVLTSIIYVTYLILSFEVFLIPLLAEFHLLKLGRKRAEKQLKSEQVFV